MADGPTSKYLTVYKRATKNSPQVGTLDEIRAGDAATYWDDNRNVTARVSESDVPSGTFRTEPSTYSKWVLRPTQVVDFKSIIELRRLNPAYQDEAHP